jgi:hypothetical protein
MKSTRLRYAALGGSLLLAALVAAVAVAWYAPVEPWSMH